MFDVLRIIANAHGLDYDVIDEADQAGQLTSLCLALNTQALNRQRRQAASPAHDALFDAVVQLHGKFGEDAFSARMVLDAADAAGGGDLSDSIQHLCGGRPTTNNLGKRLSAAAMREVVVEAGDQKLQLRREARVGNTGRWTISSIDE